MYALLLFAQALPDAAAVPKIDAPMPWWGQLLIWTVTTSVLVVGGLVIRRADVAKIKAEADAAVERIKADTDARIAKARAEGRVRADGEEGEARTAAWERLFEERRRVHERDVKRLERDLKSVHERLTETERKLDESLTREQQCQERVEQLEGRVVTLEQGSGERPAYPPPRDHKDHKPRSS